MTRAIFSTLAGAALLVAVSAAPEYKAPETTCTDPPKATYPAKHGHGYPAEYPASAKYPASKVYPVSKSYPAGYPKDPYPTTSTCTDEGSYPTDTYVKYPASTYTPSKEYPASYPAEYPSSSTTCTDEYPATYTGGSIPTGYTTKVVYSTSAYPTSTCTYDAYNSSYCTTTSAYSSYAVATTLCPVEEAYPTSTAYPVYTTSTMYSTSCYDVTTTDEYKQEKTYKTTEYVPYSTTVCTVEETYPATHAGESYPKATYTAQPVGASKPESYPAAGNATCTGYGCATGTAAYGSKPTYAVSAGALVSAAPALAAAAALSLFMGLMA